MICLQWYADRCYWYIAGDIFTGVTDAIRDICTGVIDITVVMFTDVIALKGIYFEASTWNHTNPIVDRNETISL